jgi:hypothetical protein
MLMTLRRRAKQECARMYDKPLENGPSPALQHNQTIGPMASIHRRDGLSPSSKAAGKSAAQGGAQQQSFSPAPANLNASVGASSPVSVPPPSLVMPDKLDSFVCVIGGRGGSDGGDDDRCLNDVLPCVTLFCSAAAIPRYAHEISSGNSNGPMLVRTLLQWGVQSSSDAIKAAVAQSLAALCRQHAPYLPAM